MASNTANTFTDSLNAMFKEVYSDKIDNLIPEGYKLNKAVPFMSKEKSPGNLFHQPVILGLEHGVTFASSDDDAFALNPPISGVIKDAQIRGNPIVLRSALGAMAAQRAQGAANSGNAQAFMDATKFLVANMTRTIAKKLEITLFHGQMGYGTVASTSGNVITVTTAEWAPGIWAGAEKMPLEIRDTTGATSRGVCNVTSVDLSARTVTVDALPAGTAATDVIWHRSAYGNEFAGVHKILTNTGTIFNISASTYSLWASQTQSAGSAELTMDVLEDAIALAVAKGLEGDTTVYVNPKTWSDLLSEQTAKRSYDQSYSSEVLKNGSKAVEFYSQSGKVSVEPSIYVKEGYAYVLNLEDFFKVGSTDVTFNRASGEGKYFREMENNLGFELKCLCDLALFCSAPGRSALINLII